MSCLFAACFPGRIQEFRIKEYNYIHQLKILQGNLTELVQQLNHVEELHQIEKSAWQTEKSSFLDKINELQNTLHQKEVMQKQYEIYQDNFQCERQQIQELFETLHKLEAKNEEYEGEIKKMSEDIVGYRSAIHMLADKEKMKVEKGELVKVHRTDAVVS